MASHQHKRPYAGSQPSITSYFTPSISPTTTTQPIYSIQPSTTNTHPSNSILPASIQSNLLSVGMRVRKSVPEGYKTGSYSAFTLFADNAPAIHKSTAPIRSQARARELTPFCGILKVGGLAQQHWGGNDVGGDCFGMGEEDEDDLPVLSQSSTISNDSVVKCGERKRRLVFDEDDKDLQDSEEGNKVGSWGLGTRLIAVPRRTKGPEKVRGVKILDQENVGFDVDFEEADFLDYASMGDSEMGGV